MRRDRRSRLCSKKTLVISAIGMSLCCLITYYLLIDLVLIIFQGAVLPSRFDHIEQGNANRYKLFRSEGRKVNVDESSVNWEKVKPMYSLFEELHNDHSRLYSIRKRCGLMTQLDQVRLPNTGICSTVIIEF